MIKDDAVSHFDRFVSLLWPGRAADRGTGRRQHSNVPAQISESFRISYQLY